MRNESPLQLKPIKYDTIKKVASIKKRIAAAFIDALIFILPSFINFQFNTNWIASEVTIIVVGIVGILYKVLMTYHFGGTVGKLALKIRVVNCNMKRVTLKQSILRVLVDSVLILLNWIIRIYTLSEIGIDTFTALTNVERGKLLMETSVIYPLFLKVNQIWSIGDSLSVLINGDNRALHDFIAGTIVVKKEYAEV